MSESFQGIPRAGLEFLKGLAEHNKKEWFEANRAAWDNELLPAMLALCEALCGRVRDVLPHLTFAPRIGGSIYRLNRDIRFSHDKRPYKSNAAALLWEGAEKHASPGVYLHIAPGEVIFGGGLYLFEEAQLERYRKRLALPASGEALVEALAIAKKHGLKPDGEKLIRPPRGFSPEHPRAELSKHKGLVVAQTLKPGPWVHTETLLDKAEAAARAYAPLHAWLRDELCR